MSTIVIKIGTNILTTEENKLDLNNLRQLVDQLAHLKNKLNKNILIVTSGAITCGAQLLKLPTHTIPQKQAAHAVGQILLMQEYQHFFNLNNLHPAQILLTKDCVDDPKKKQNVLNTIQTLLSENIIPIINENDSVATDEIQENFGDNDALSAIVATMINAAQLIILTDTDGLFDRNPKHHPNATRIPHIAKIDDAVLALVQDTHNNKSRGGMASKLLSAQRATQAGIKVTIANGRTPNILIKIITSEGFGTTFEPISDKQF